MQQEFKFDNVYAESVPSRPIIEEKTVKEIEIQTEQEQQLSSQLKSPKKIKNTQINSGSDKVLADRLAEESTDSKEERRKRSRSRRKRRGKNKDQYYTQIDEDEGEDQYSLIDGEDTQREFL